jgi:REP element-mobilizing transposase RayT
MRNKKHFNNPHNLYFLTTSAFNHLFLFVENSIKRILIDTLDTYRLRKRIRLFSFVIMSNHIHLVAQIIAPETLSDVVRDFKSHTADRILRHYRRMGETDKLAQVSLADPSKKGQKHQIWEHGYHAIGIISEQVLAQKITYIHENPCRTYPPMCDHPEHYPWSSAVFYLTDQPCIIPIDDVRELLG